MTNTFFVVNKDSATAMDEQVFPEPRPWYKSKPRYGVSINK